MIPVNEAQQQLPDLIVSVSWLIADRFGDGNVDRWGAIGR